MRLRRFVSRLGIASWLLAVGVLAGCASGLEKSATSVDLNEKSLVVLSVRFTNAYRPSFTATMLGLGFRHMDAVAAPPPPGPTRLSPPAKPETQFSQPAAAEVFVLQLPPGKYEVSRLTGTAPSGILMGKINTTVVAPFELKPRSAMYLGHIDLTNIERTNKADQPTGTALPLIDQIASGMTGGTLAVRLVDRYEADLARAKNDYPALRAIDVVRAPLARMSIDSVDGPGTPSKEAVVVR